MANYTVADIQALRERTGAGMLDVKKALDEADGDLDKAVDVLRVKGLKGVSKREGRSASEGLVITHIADGGAGQVGTLIEINSETDFVAKNDKFVALAEAVLKAVVDAGAADLDAALAAPVEAARPSRSSSTRTLACWARRSSCAAWRASRPPWWSTTCTRPTRTCPRRWASWSVRTPRQVRSLATSRCTSPPTRRSTSAATRLPTDVVENERRVAEETSRAEGKPEAALPKIVEGRMNGFFKENVLPEQAFAKDPKTTVGKVVEATGGEVTAFARFRVGA